MPSTFLPLLRRASRPGIAGLIGAPATAALAAPDWRAALDSPLGTGWAAALLGLMGVIVLLAGVQAVRHHRRMLARLFGAPASVVDGVVSADWPQVTVLVLAQDDAAALEASQVRLMAVDYPPERLLVVPVGGRTGRATALRNATRTVDTDFLVIIDADCRPAPGLLRSLVAPFFDPEVGAVVGRAVPTNSGANLMTRLLDLVRAGDHQIGRRADLTLDLVPAHGGVVCALRLAALRAVGGWRDEVRAADADLACRLQRGGWTTIHADRAISHAADATRWAIQARAMTHQARGRHEVLSRHLAATLTTPARSWRARLDGALQLGSHAMAPVLLAGWLLALLLYCTVAMDGLAPALLVMAFTLHSVPGHCAAFFEIAAATRLDRSNHRVRLLAFHWLGTLVETVAITRALLTPAGRGSGTDPADSAPPGGRP